MTEPETTGRDHAGRFAAGNSGNPSGRPRGARHAALLALDAVGEDRAQMVLQKMLEMARTGDTTAADILPRRLWPVRRSRPVTFDLPPLNEPSDLVAALAAVASSMAAGEMSPDEAQAASAVLETWRKACRTTDIEQRLAALERAAGRMHREKRPRSTDRTPRKPAGHTAIR